MTRTASTHPACNRQRGAMFGMDARIALIVAAILTAAGGITLMSKLESNKAEAAQQQALVIRDGLGQYYQQTGINHLPDTLADLFSTGAVTDPSLKKDPWGNPWEYSHTTATVKVEGTPITMQMAVVYSRGKDGVADSGGVNNDSDFNQWQPRNDDIGAKFISRDIEEKRLQNYRARAQLIVSKLEASENAAFLQAQNTCGNAGLPSDDSSTTASSVPSWCTDTGGKNYTLFNYYPKSNADDTDGVVYYADKVLGHATYNSGNLVDMQQMMIDLGLPAAYAQDPWGRTLMYNGNITNRTDPPYSASICFSSGENCLTAVDQ